MFAAILGALSQSGSGGCTGASEAGALNTKGIPPQLPPLYAGAATKFRLGPLGPSMLASINEVETDFGRNKSTSNMGAVGWMQFIPSTWKTYGVDANHDGKKDLQDPADAIYGAANYLAASAGRPKPDKWTEALWRKAIFSYNHAGWYVDKVWNGAKKLRQGGQQLAPAAGSSSSARPSLAAVGSASPAAGSSTAAVGYPLERQGKYLGGVAAHKARALGNWQSDNAVDLGAPTGTGILAVGDGTIVKTGGSPPSHAGGVIGGFNITLQTSTDSYFYTHLTKSSVHPGQRVKSGELIGQSGYAAGVEHLHIGVMKANPDELWGPGAGAAPKPASGDCGGETQPTGPAELDKAKSLTSPRAFKTLPAAVMAGGRPPAQVDARIYDDAVWVLTTYHLRVTAGRAPGHKTHGSGTAMDMVPANGNSQQAWDDSAKKLATDLGWSTSCAAAGRRPPCKLKPAIIGIFYNGFSEGGHGDPAHCAGSCQAHIHVSWDSPCFGSPALAPPCQSVKVFPAPAAPGLTARRSAAARLPATAPGWG